MNTSVSEERGRRMRALSAGLLVAAIGATALAGVVPAAPAAAAPGTPGVAQDPILLYSEDFENRPSPTPVVRVNEYVGESGATYTAADPWLRDCNGWVASAQQPIAVPAAQAQISDCRLQRSWNSSQQLTAALGAFQGDADPSANFAVTAYTSANPGGGLVEFQTGDPIALTPGGGRFIAFSVDVAAINCEFSAPRLRFELIDEQGTAIGAGPAADACTLNPVAVPALGVAPASPVNVGTFVSPSAVLTTSDTIGLRMINQNGSGTGNDHAFDDIRILDATPQLDKSFVDPDGDGTVIAGEVVDLVFDVTNTSELAAKNGWSFTDTLDGSVVAGTATTTCPSGVVTAPVGATSVAVRGNLATDQIVCSITVPVRATAAGTLSNGADDLDVDGLNLPATAEIDVQQRVPAAAADDTARTLAGAPVVVDVLADDTAGSYPLDPASLRLVGPEGALVESLDTPEGVFAVVDGEISFTPAPGFQGSVPDVTYSVADTGPLAERVTAGLAITVRAQPVALDDSAATLPGVAADIDVLGNDSADGAIALDTGSVTFPPSGQPTGSSVSADGKTLSVPGEGVYTIDDDGVVTFTPEDGFEGPTTPVLYSVNDTEGNVATARIDVSVATTPSLADDRSTTEYDTPVTIDVLSNDSGDGLDPASVVFTSAGQPAGSVVAAGGKALTVPGEGSYRIGADGQVTFTPERGLSGATTSPVVYRATDRNGLTAEATVTIDVAAGPPASARSDSSSTPAGRPVTIDVLANDSPTAGADWVPSSVVFPTDGQPENAVVSDGGKTLTVPGEGVYRIADDGRVTFTPEAGFSGRATPIVYAATDTSGSVVTPGIEIVVTASPSAPPGSDGSTLPVTGPVSPGPIAAAAMLLLLVGASIVIASSASRRSRRE